MAVCCSNPNFQTYGLLQKVLYMSPVVSWDNLYFLFKWYCTFTLNKIYDGMTCQGTELISSAFSLFPRLLETFERCRI